MIDENGVYVEDKVEGEGHIWCDVIADSINELGDRITTMRLHYPRFIHSEFMTHRMFSRNASSSRAIPIAKQLETIRDTAAMPIHWGKNQPGMKAKEQQNNLIAVAGCDECEPVMYSREHMWELSAEEACQNAELFDAAGYHKQIVNRITEPYTFMNVIVSATDFDNFFWLRCHPDAQPEIQELAHCMRDARANSCPELLAHGIYHTPYVDHVTSPSRPDQILYAVDSNLVDEDTAIKVSASMCAQVSYRAIDTSIEKANKIFDMLIGMSPLHSSPFEHIATPFSTEEYNIRLYVHDIMKANEIPDNCNHSLYSGNFMGWQQLRKTFADENHFNSGQ